MATRTVNIYRDGDVWCYAIWVNGEYDCNGVIGDAESEDDAIAHVLAMWPDADVRRVDDVR